MHLITTSFDLLHAAKGLFKYTRNEIILLLDYAAMLVHSLFTWTKQQLKFYERSCDIMCWKLLYY